MDPKAVHHLRQAFIALPSDLKKQVCELIQAHHRHLSPSVFYEECLIADRCGVAFEKTKEAEVYFWRCLKSYAQPGFSERAGYEAFALRAAHRHEEDSPMWNYDVLSAAHAHVNREVWTKGKIVLPKGLDPVRVAWVWVQDGPAQSYTLLQQGLHLVAQKPIPSGAPDNESHMTGSPVVNLISSDGVLQVHALDGKDETLSYAVNLKSPTPVPIDLPEGRRLQLSTTYHEATIESIKSPPWAKGWGRDELGLFVILPQEEKTRKAYWFAPGRYPVGRYAADLIVLDDPGRTGLLDGGFVIEVNQGFWWDEHEFKHQSQNGFQKPEWAHDFGVDEYGIYAEFHISSAVQRMRWIMPIEFMMGSPEREPDRWEDEQQHKVILTRGFWLADTACTQALWQAVMSDNPSDFKGDDHPVDSVSWDDIQIFIGKINSTIPGL
ncbi:MAG: hypothetical protein GY703_17525, partial [Gammaproteobacteria bacterium]|nr:hypothetical protein [Gammaproteobacteria bacterium]